MPSAGESMFVFRLSGCSASRLRPRLQREDSLDYLSKFKITDKITLKDIVCLGHLLLGD